MMQSDTTKSLGFQGANNLVVESKTNTDKPEPKQVPISIVELITGQHFNGLYAQLGEQERPKDPEIDSGVKKKKKHDIQPVST